VVDSQAEQIEATISSLERHRSPEARLKALVGELSAQADVIARYGCPQGRLCSELAKGADGDPANSARLLIASIQWAESQFEEMNRSDAHDLAIQLIAAYQGAAVLANALGQPALLKTEARRIERWIDSISATAQPAG
jgi:hypothetical protein